MTIFQQRTSARLSILIVFLVTTSAFAQIAEDLDSINRFMGLDMNVKTEDGNGDGIADKVFFDRNGDGVIDAFRTSSGYDSVLDSATVLGPGIFRTYTDENRDGYFDSVASLERNTLLISYRSADNTWTAWADILADLGGQVADSQTSSEPSTQTSTDGESLTDLMSTTTDPQMSAILQNMYDSRKTAIDMQLAPACTFSLYGCR